MPTGLKVPVGVDKSGGAAVETDPAEQNKKILRLALSEGDDNNPFQSLGGFRELIFNVRDASVRAKATRRLKNIVARFSDRISLEPNSNIEFDTSVPGEVTLSFEYTDLLTNTIEEFRERLVG